MSKIVTLTLNPALDISTEVERLVPAVKMRCARERVDPGGGGLNAARTIAALGGDALAIHCSGGSVGRRLERLLEREGVDQLAVRVDGETRQSFAVHEREAGHQYRFVLPGPPMVSAEWTGALAAVSDAVEEGGYVLGSGSLPPGAPADFYARLARTVQVHDAKLVLDTAGPALEAALGSGIHLIKPNWREFDALLGVSRPPDDPARRAEAVRMADEGAAEIVIVTLGEHGALIANRDGAIEIAPPPVEVVSAVGGGDAFAGAVTLGFSRGLEVEAACRLAVAAAAAAVGTLGTAPPMRREVERVQRAMDGGAQAAVR